MIFVYLLLYTDINYQFNTCRHHDHTLNTYSCFSRKSVWIQLLGIGNRGNILLRPIFFGQNLASFDDKSSRSMTKWQPTTLLSPRFMLFLCFAKECFLHKTITSQHLLKEGGKEGTMCARE